MADAHRDDVDPLAEYRRRRNFSHTPEPGAAPDLRRAGAEDGGDPQGDAPLFVVQRHRAQRLHYDLRLEADGVLVSWAVPRGPTLDPSLRRLAVRTEDHPLAYADFEGVIPRGEYGAGDVIVWDRGTYQLNRGGSLREALAAGEVHVTLRGEKLSGRFALVRTRRSGDGGHQWLLVHADDEHAVAGWDPEDRPRSVLSGRTNDQVHQPATPPAPPGPGARWHPPSQAQLEELDAMGANGTWHVDGVDVALTNLDKVLFPAREGGAPVTKRDLVRHYATVAPFLLAHLWDRPVNLQRFPDGVGGEGFWQKNVPTGAPEWVTRWRDPTSRPGRTEVYTVADRPATLVWLANLAAVELHPWTSRTVDPHRPTWALFDIDPGPATSFDDVVVLARLHRRALEHLGLVGVPKVTGRRGLQIWVPVGEGHDFERTRRFTETVSRSVASLVPELVSWEWRTGDRRGLARLDYTQNAHHKTLVAPWSTRPAAGAPVSVPLRWDELEDPDLRPDRYTVRDVPARLAEAGDPLAEVIGTPQELPRL